jgi:hypothetical protein
MQELYLWGAVGVLTILGSILSQAFRIAAFVVVSGFLLYFAALMEPIYPTLEAPPSASHSQAR